MVSSKKKAQLWRKAIIHFSLCFVMGFFTGFMPTAGKTPRSFLADGGVPPEASRTAAPELPPASLNRSLAAEIQAETRSNTIRESVETLDKEEEEEEHVIRKEERRLLIIVTATSGRDGNRGALLRRLGNTLSLVAAPVLWVVVEAREEEAAEGEEVAEMLRKTRVMHRHVVVVRGNATRRRRELEEEDEEMEMRNVAVAQLQHHRITGILHFAALHNVYDLHFFQALRDIEVYGSWPVAFLSPNRKRVVIEGPVCKSARVVGWHHHHHHHHHHTNPIGQQQQLLMTGKKNQTLSSTSSSSPPIRLSNLAFNTSILWDPERWGRASSSQHTTMQNSIEFVKQEILEDEGALRGIPSHDCSKILLWHLHFLTKTTTY